MGAAIVAFWLKVWGFGLILLSVWRQRTIDGMCSLMLWAAEGNL